MVVLNKNADSVPLELDRFSERLNGFSEMVDVIGGGKKAIGEFLELPPRSVQVLELK